MANALDIFIGTHGSVYDEQFGAIADVLLEQGTLLYEEEEKTYFAEVITSCYEYQGKFYELWHHVKTPETSEWDLQYGFNSTLKYWE